MEIQLLKTLRWIALLAGCGLSTIGTLAGVYCGLRPTDDDVTAALAPIASFPLSETYRGGSVLLPVAVPDTPRWQRIRRSWGEPDFAILVTPADHRAACLARIGLQIQVREDDRAVPVWADGAPYGYSADCDQSSIRFHASPGAKLNVQISGDRSIPINEHLVVTSDWRYFKDNIVGSELDHKVVRAGTVMFLAGILLLVVAALLRRMERGSAHTAMENPL